MKANETPEKIYLDSYGSGFSHGFHTNKLHDNDVEYIRKDAFIEKTEKWLKEHTLDYAQELNCGVGKTQPDYYTKHFIEDFKTYIKGE